jgi:hypothetical protein
MQFDTLGYFLGVFYCVFYAEQPDKGDLGAIYPGRYLTFQREITNR